MQCRAVGLGASGRLYVGVNLEFARLPVNNSVHAEQFLVVNAVHHGETAITKMAVSAAPCGHCRQFYSELCCAVSPLLPLLCMHRSGICETTSQLLQTLIPQPICCPVQAKGLLSGGVVTRN